MTSADGRWIADSPSRLPLEKKVAQLLTVEASGACATVDDPRLARLIGLVPGFGVGGVVAHGGSPRDVASLTNPLQREADLPLPVLADFEAGPGQQVTGASEFPPNMALAAMGSEDLAREVGAVGGAEGPAMGNHLTFHDLWYDRVVARFGTDDIVMKPEDPWGSAARIVEGVGSGGLSEARIDETAVAARVGTAAHLAIVQAVADRSLTLLKNDGVAPAGAGLLCRSVNISTRKAEQDPSPPALTSKLAAAFSGSTSLMLMPDTDAAVHERARVASRDAKLVIFPMSVPRDRLGSATPPRERDLALIDAIAREKPGRTLAVSYGNPYLVKRIGSFASFVVGWGEKGWCGNQAMYFDSLIAFLNGTLRPEGRLPVFVSEDYPIEAGLRG